MFLRILVRSCAACHDAFTMVLILIILAAILGRTASLALVIVALGIVAVAAPFGTAMFGIAGTDALLVA